MTEEKKDKKICLVHYGIGWKDGVNTVLRTLADQIREQMPNLKICFVGGEIKERTQMNEFDIKGL